MRQQAECRPLPVLAKARRGARWGALQTSRDGHLPTGLGGRRLGPRLSERLGNLWRFGFRLKASNGLVLLLAGPQVDAAEYLQGARGQLWRVGGWVWIGWLSAWGCSEGPRWPATESMAYTGRGWETWGSRSPANTAEEAAGQAAILCCVTCK